MKRALLLFAALLGTTVASLGQVTNISVETFYTDNGSVAGYPAGHTTYRIYANTTDNVAADNLLSGVTQSATLTDPTSPSEWVSDIFAAASTILSNSNGNLPNVLITNPAYYAALGALTDTAGRPLFPNVGPQNALGTTAASNFNGNAFGLNLVVDRNLTAGGVSNLYVGDSTGFECWEQQRGAVSVELADGALGRIIKFRGYFSSVMIDATKFVRKA
jgi:hypothetical protein